MARRHGSMLAMLSLALGLLVVVAGPAPSASALPSECQLPLEDRPQHVYVWKGGSTNHDWANPANWEHNPGADPTFGGFPQDDLDNNGASDRTSTVVCISVSTPDYVSLTYNTFGGAFVWLKEIHVEGPFTIQMTPDNTGLLIDGTTNPSSFGPGSVLDLRGTFGGHATINVSGTIVATSIAGFPAQLTSRKICSVEDLLPFCPPGSLEPDYTGPAGTLVINPGGGLILGRRGVGLSYHYNLDIQGTTTIAPSPGGAAETPYLAASDGTSVDVMSGGTLGFAGNGGLYRGRILPAQPLSPLRNAGTVVKTGAGTTSVVDTAYSLQAGGVVDVQAGTLTLPEGAAAPAELTAKVDGGSSFGTGTCGAVVPADGAACGPTVGSADPRSLSVTMPSGDGDGSVVSLREDVPGAGLAFDGVTEITGLQALPHDPARIHARLPAVASDANLDTVGVASGSGGDSYPTCLGSGAPPFGAFACVDRRGLPTSSRVVDGNLYMEVRYVANVRRSRWIVLRGSADVAAPTLYGSTEQKDAVKVLTRRKRVKPITVSGLRCSERCTLSGAGSLSLKIGNRRRELALRGAKQAASGETVTLRVKLSRKAQTKVAKASTKKGRATLLVTSTDGAGNPVTMQVLVKIRFKR